jgi:hypothetical protein
MNREDMINELRQLAPIITDVRQTFDMGYEFSAVVPEGVIYAEPGMLLNYSGGDWLLGQWKDKTNKEYKESLRSFLLDETWEVTKWEELSDEKIEKWLEEISKTGLYQFSDQDNVCGSDRSFQFLSV